MSSSENWLIERAVKKKKTKKGRERTVEQPGSSEAHVRVPKGRMNFKEAKAHVFGVYRDVLKKLAE